MTIYTREYRLTSQAWNTTLPELHHLAAQQVEQSAVRMERGHAEYKEWKRESAKALADQRKIVESMKSDKTQMVFCIVYLDKHYRWNTMIAEWLAMLPLGRVHFCSKHKADTRSAMVVVFRDLESSVYAKMNELITDVIPLCEREAEIFRAGTSFPWEEEE